MKQVFKRLSTPGKIVQVIVLDLVGAALIVCSLLFGWLPGVGGIPLFLAGLGVLSLNHHWARQLLLQVKKQGGQMFHKLFREYPALKIVFDIVAPLLIIISTFVFTSYDNNLVQSLAGTLAFLALSLFLANRGRYEYFKKLALRIIGRQT